jgi:subtilase family serine protease
MVLNSSGTSATCYSEYAINVTSELNVNGQYTLLNGSLKQVNLTCNILNEGKPALAQNFTVYYEQDGSLSTEEWIQVASPSITDYGNGTYRMSFTANTTSPADPMLISVYSQDLRHVFVKANVTCTMV